MAAGNCRHFSFVHLARYATPHEFLDALGNWLARDVSANNLLLSFASRRRAAASSTPDYYAGVLEGFEVLAAAALGVGGGVLPAGNHGAALATLAEDIAALGLRPQGVVGEAAAAQLFADAYATQTASGVELRHRLRHLALHTLPEVASHAGAMRLAKAEDRELIEAWWSRFQAETGAPGHVADLLKAIERPPSDRGILLWCDPAPVSMAAFTLLEPDAARVSLVYTPAAFRCRGYAEALVTALSRALMRGHIIDDRPRRACFLTTDATNPVSNAIYERIGYRHEGNMVHLDFTAPGETSGPGSLVGAPAGANSSSRLPPLLQSAGLGAAAPAPPGETSGPAQLASEAGRNAAPPLRRCLGAAAPAPPGETS